MWHIPGELKRFKEITTGHPIIMGRKTYESIGRPLPNRTNIVITRDSNYSSVGVIVTNSLEEAIKKAKEAPGAEEIFIIGGGQIYSQALPITDRLYLTLVEGDFGADAFFPEYSEFKKVISTEQHESGAYRYQYKVVEKDL